MSKAKTERVEELRTLLTEQEPSTHTPSALAARFGVALGTLGTDISGLLREGMVDRDDLVHCGLLRPSSVETLEALPVRTRSGSAGRVAWMRSAATILLNLHARADEYDETDAFFEARLVMVAREMASRASVVPGQRIMPFAIKVPDRGSVTQADDGTFRICEHLRCLRVEGPGDVLPPCPVWNKTGDEYRVDVKARRTVRDEFFIINQADAQVMIYWPKPSVVIYERTGELEIDASRFCVVDQRLLSKLAMVRKPPPLVKARLPQNSIVF